MLFDAAAQNWDSDLQKVERAKVLAQYISDFVQGKNLNKALEFGCGTGLLSFHLKDAFPLIDLADTSEGMIEVLKKKISDNSLSHFKPILLEAKPAFQPAAYDMVYSLMTLHHIENLDAVFNDFYRMLKPGGYLCIADLVKEDGDFHNSEDSKHVHHGFEKEQLLKQLKVHGFEEMVFQEFFFINKTTEQGKQKNFPLFFLIVQKT
ncbi:MAG: class I SAM-dependent methyltransferase [Bacteroidetes bacterium HGW-Bacteroidetes-4]|jgi:ubiquinone/menaquinone biosynthesis C-methylase UbiE|nr:MAG: class I SAM-dependent methyltransferase [Bacteroidetes bacterium HGW-Bacteroidetes-4]